MEAHTLSFYSRNLVSISFAIDLHFWAHTYQNTLRCFGGKFLVFSDLISSEHFE